MAIASHFVLAPGDSRASRLQLGGGERVSLAALMGRFYQHLAAGQGKADALRSAQLALLAQPEATRQTARGLQPVAPALQAPQNAVRHPYYWGAFVLLADGR